MGEGSQLASFHPSLHPRRHTGTTFKKMGAVRTREDVEGKGESKGKDAPASSSTSAVRYSRIAEVYTAAFAPMRTLCWVRCLRYLCIRPTGNCRERTRARVVSKRSRVTSGLQQNKLVGKFEVSVAHRQRGSDSRLHVEGKGKKQRRDATRTWRPALELRLWRTFWGALVSAGAAAGALDFPPPFLGGIVRVYVCCEAQSVTKWRRERQIA